MHATGPQRYDFKAAIQKMPKNLVAFGTTAAGSVASSAESCLYTIAIAIVRKRLIHGAAWRESNCPSHGQQRRIGSCMENVCP